jgi:hypothetical protein
MQKQKLCEPLRCSEEEAIHELVLSGQGLIASGRFITNIK